MTVALLFSFVQFAFAASFVVEDIEVEGLQRIRLGTVLNYLPIDQGETFDTENSGTLIRALYDTGFFQKVSIARRGNTLVVRVIERATIGSIDVNGNRDIATKQLEDVLRQLQLVQGEVFQPSTLEKMSQELRQEYNNRGKYNARIKTSVTQLTQGRVAIVVDISEGKVARIKSINIIGNEAFSEGQLLDQFKLSTSGLLTFITGKDKYTVENMTASLEELQSYYMNRGFIRYRLESSQVLLTPDKKDVYIDIKIDEGPRYTFSSYRFTGDLILDETVLDKVVNIQEGDYYSHERVTQSVEIIGEALGNRGYGFPSVDIEPIIDEETKEVFITYVISPGRQTYVRYIDFKGNIRTADYVLRRAMRQNEGGLLSLAAVRESERQLRLLQYLENISVETVPVPGTNNQVDLEFSVTEMPSTEAIASVGYGTNGFEVNASLNQYNFMGTGQSLGFNFNQSRWGQNYSVNHYDPYYTVSGIGRGVTGYYRRFTPGNFDIAAFATSSFGGTVSYNFMVNNNNGVQAGYGYNYLDIV
ncbi:MAG: outer membrane protein assembly factor BamA, partial [Gammaproteobacteria bacterium]